MLCHGLGFPAYWHVYILDGCEHVLDRHGYVPGGHGHVPSGRGHVLLGADMFTGVPTTYRIQCLIHF